MSDVLKQVEEALVEIADDGIENSRDRRTLLAQAALTALRGLKWRPIAEAPDGSLRGYALGMDEHGAWQKYLPSSLERADAVALGWTHFCRPILPTPPKREVE